MYFYINFNRCNPYLGFPRVMVGPDKSFEKHWFRLRRVITVLVHICYFCHVLVKDRHYRPVTPIMPFLNDRSVAAQVNVL